MLSIGLGSLVLGLPGCSSGSPAQPAPTALPADATVNDTAAGPLDSGAGADTPAPYYGICPDAMAPTFPSILTQMFATASCGVGSLYDCHSPTGSLLRSEGGTGNLLDFSLDAAAVYAELLGDGGGQPAVNIQGDAGGVLLRIAPGNADASLLYIKVAMSAGFDPRYGLAMPPTVVPCPAVVETLRAWIDDGAAPK
jgi:hypothetical protein